MAPPPPPPPPAKIRKTCFRLLDRDYVVDKTLETISDQDVISFANIIKQHKEHLSHHIEKILNEVIKNRRLDFFGVLDENYLLSSVDPATLDNLPNPMYEVITNGDVEWVELLCKHHLYVTKLETPIFFLLKLRQKWNNIDAYKKILEIFLKYGLGNDDKYENETPIFYASKQKMWHYVEILLKHGANIDIFCNGKTSRRLITDLNPALLKYAAKKKLNPKFQLFESLLLKKEKIFIDVLKENPQLSNSEDETGFTLLQLAIQQQLKNAVYKLLQYGADPNTCNNFNNEKHFTPTVRYMPPAIMSLLSGQNEIFIVLINHHNINLRTNYSKNNTIYHILATEWKYLHFKKIKNSVIELVDILFNECFESGVNILQKNETGHSAISIACKSGDKRLIKIFFQYGGFSALNEKDLKKISCQLLTELFDECVSNRLTKDGVVDYIEIDYGFIDAAIKSKVKSIHNTSVKAVSDIKQENSYDSTSTVSLQILPEKILTQKYANLEMNLFQLLRNSKTHVMLLRHPVVKTFLFLKWKKIFPIYFINFIIYLLFTISLSFYVHDYEALEFMKFNSTNSSNEEAMDMFDVILNVEWLLTAVFTIIIVLRELLEFKFSKTDYLRSIENYLELSLLASVIYLLLFGPQQELAAIAVILAYFELTLLIGRYPYISLYITIFIQVILKSLGLLCIFFPLIFAFAFGFDLIFHNNNNSRTISSLGISIFNTFMMTNGEIEPDKYNLDVSSLLSRLLFILFFIFIVISFSNVLNALAISDTQAIINKAKTLIRIQEVELYSKLEQSWMSFLSRKDGLLVDFFCYCIKYNVNACPKKFTNRISIFKLETSLNAVPYFTHNIHKYIFGYNRNEVIKKLIEISESVKKDYCYNNDNARYLYAGSEDEYLKSATYEIRSNNNSEIYAEGENRDSSIYGDIRFLFDEDGRLARNQNLNNDRKSLELDNGANIFKPKADYDYIGDDFENQKLYNIAKQKHPKLPLPEELTEVMNNAMSKTRQEIDRKIEKLAEDMKSKLEVISSDFSSKLECLSNDLRDIKQMLHSNYEKL